MAQLLLLFFFTIFHCALGTDDETLAKTQKVIDAALNGQTKYEQLGVEPSDTSNTIRRTYYSSARLLHPDKTTGKSYEAEAAEAFKIIADVYEVLSDAEQRRNYDAVLEFKRRQEQQEKERQEQQQQQSWGYHWRKANEERRRRREEQQWQQQQQQQQQASPGGGWTHGAQQWWGQTSAGMHETREQVLRQMEDLRAWISHTFEQIGARLHFVVQMVQHRLGYQISDPMYHVKRRIYDVNGLLKTVVRGFEKKIADYESETGIRKRTYVGHVKQQFRAKDYLKPSWFNRQLHHAREKLTKIENGLSGFASSHHETQKINEQFEALSSKVNEADTKLRENLHHWFPTAN